MDWVSLPEPRRKQEVEQFSPRLAWFLGWIIFLPEQWSLPISSACTRRGHYSLPRSTSILKGPCRMMSAGKTDCSISQHKDTLWTRKKVEKPMYCSLYPNITSGSRAKFSLTWCRKHPQWWIYKALFGIHHCFAFFFSFHQIRLLLANKYIRIKNKIKHHFSILIRIFKHLVIIRSHITKDAKINENPKYYRVHLMLTPTLTPFQYLKHKT